MVENTDKDLPQNSDGDHDKNNPEHDDHHDHQKQDTDNLPTSGELPAEIEEKSNNIETEIKVEEEEGEKEPITTNDEESSPSPDFDKVSKEIDQFTSDLSSAKGEESELPEVPEFMDEFAFFVEAKIANYDSIESPVKWTQVAEEDSSLFLETVDRVCKLTSSLSEFSSESKYGSTINRIGGILHRAMSYLEDEFRLLLLEDSQHSSANLDHNNDSKAKQSPSLNSIQESDNSAMPESDSTEENNFPGYSKEVVSNMNRLAKTMLSAGYETECCQVYIVSRRNLFEESLRKLEFEKLSFDDVQKMQWETLEKTIVSWIDTFKQCTTVYLPGERKLSEAVFSNYASISESLYGSLSRGLMIELLNFVEAVAMSKRLAEKLFKFLDIYETLRDAIPTMDALFPEECVHDLKSEALLTRFRLGRTMVCIFLELENSIKADAGRTPVPGGAVHPLTRYTMNYLKYACEYKDTLEQVFREIQKIEQADPATASNTGLEFVCDNNNYKAEGHDDSNSSSSSSNDQTSENEGLFATQMMKLMDLLDTNLEAKSKLYKDTSLSLIFMMNNGRYIMQKIKSAKEINGLIGNMWCRKRSSDLRLFHKNYQRETWGKLLQCLSYEGLIVKGKVVKPVLKEKFKSFNALFDEIHRTQSMWVMSDEQLQSELRVSISAVVIPAYRSFLARFSQNFTPGRQTEKYIKYQPEDIETHIEELFDGGNATAPTMWRRRP